MSYKIGQLRKNQISSYSREISLPAYGVTSSMTLPNSNTTVFYISSTETFQKDKNYYVKFQFTFPDYASDGSTIKLLGSIFGNDKKQPIKYFSAVKRSETVIDPETGKPTTKQIPIECEMVFTPNDSVYTRVILENVGASSYYITIDTEKDGDKYKHLQMQELINVIPRLNNGNVSLVQKIGIQAPTNFMMIMNGEELRVGKNGVYETEDVNIKNIGFVIKKNDSEPYSNTEDFFIMDYLYS